MQKDRRHDDTYNSLNGQTKSSIVWRRLSIADVICLTNSISALIMPNTFFGSLHGVADGADRFFAGTINGFIVAS
jgi:hypothetical protein